MIVGRGSTAERLAELAGRLGYEEIRLVDDVPADLATGDHVVVAEDQPGPGRELLVRAACAAVVPAYLGYAAPHAEGVNAFVALAGRDVPRERLARISAPAGVDVGAETPDEVAISVAAELVAVRRGRLLPSEGRESPGESGAGAPPRGTRFPPGSRDGGRN